MAKILKNKELIFSIGDSVSCFIKIYFKKTNLNVFLCVVFDVFEFKDKSYILTLGTRNKVKLVKENKITFT